jgi:hypothetical protein
MRKLSTAQSIMVAYPPQPEELPSFHCQISHRQVSTLNLNRSPIRIPSTQKISPEADSATTRRRRSATGTFWFVNKSCSFTAVAMPMG